MKKFLSTLTALALVVLMVPAANAAGAVLTLTPATVTTTGITTANDVNVAYTTAGAFSSGDTIKITVKDSTGALIAGSPAAASTGADTQAVNAADGSFGYAAGTATYTFGAGAAAGTAVSLDFALPNLVGGVYTINVAENRSYSTQPETYGSSQLNVNASLVGATLAFVQSTPATITDSGNGFITAGFKAGQAITVAGATTVGNDGTYIIQAVAAGTLTLQAGATLAAAEAGAAGTVVSAATQANQVRVSAVVEPILAVALSANAVDLGVIVPGSITDSASDTTLTIKTNANGGYIVQAAASTVTGANSAATVPFTSRSVMAGAPTVSGFSMDVASVGQAAGTSTVDATAGLGVASTYAVANGAASFAGASAGLGASVAGTTAGDTIVANYAMTVSAVQPADNYSTTVTYTVTGSF